MREKILLKLKEIEEKENVKIILAVESGSRAWGFESKDSDYDVRFIYVRKLKDYLRLEKTSDVIEWQLDDVYDINGWDLSKALHLLYKSNPTLFEWSFSPIIYKKSDEWQQVEKIMLQYFDPQKSLYHYLNIAKKDDHSMKEEVKLKKYFYVLRSIFCSLYIVEHQSPPPVLFQEFDFGQLSPIIHQLLKEKNQANETTIINRITELDQYIENSISFLKNVTLPHQKNDYQKLNDVFCDILKVSH